MKNNLGRRIINLFTNNIGLKFLAVAFSCGLWIVINNINNPFETKTFYNVPVEIINASSITSEGKVYDIVGGTETVNVSVEGRSKVLDELAKDDIRAVADMSELTFMNTVSIKVSSTRNNSELKFRSSVETLQLSIEDMKNISLPIIAYVTGEPAEGYVVGSTTPSQNIVRLSGPESVISSIKRVEATTSVTGFSTDINTNVELKLYDADDKEIKNNSVTMNISTVNIAVTILATKEVPLSFAAAGAPKDGYGVGGDITSDPATVKVAGRKTALDAITKLSVNDSAIDLTDRDESFTQTVNIRKYLPSNIQLADSSFNGNVNVTVNIEKIIEKTFNIPAAKIAVSNAPTGFKLIKQDVPDGSHATYNIRVSGIESAVNSIDEDSIIGVVDMDAVLNKYGLTEWAAGGYQGDLTFNLPENVTLSQTYVLNIILEQETDNEVDEEE